MHIDLSFETSLMILGYLSGINVCDHPEKNPCTYIKYCIDLEGVVSCACPEGMSGDGRKNGRGCCFSCQKHFPLDTVLGNFNKPQCIAHAYHITSMHINQQTPSKKIKHAK
jgi:hypothetical protein